MDICLVYPPYEFLNIPPLGIPLLVGAAKRAGLDITARYAGFEFAERIGIWEYMILSRFLEDSPLAEWTFAGAAFPDFKPDHETFLAERFTVDAAELDGLFKDEAAFRDAFMEIRNQAEKFIAELVNSILDENPTIVAAGSTFNQNCASLALLAGIKKKRPETVTIMGGPNCDSSMGRVVQQSFPFVDYVISGDADEIFPDLCSRIMDNPASPNMTGIQPGVFGRDIPLPLPGMPDPAAVLDDLDRTAEPDYSDYLTAFNKFKYKEKLGKPMLMMETSRGCWWGQAKGCSFCGCNGARAVYRKKSPARTLAEIDSLTEQYDLDDLAMTDTIMNMAYFKTVLPALARKNPKRPSILWTTTAKLSEEQIKSMARAGINWFGPGIEQLHDRLLALLNKPCDAAGNIALLKYAHEQGVKVDWNMLVDFPGEEDEWYGETARWLPLVTHLQPPKRIGSIRFVRFSKYHENQKQWGLKLKPWSWYKYIYPLSENQLEDFALRFDETRAHSWQGEPGPGKKATLSALEEWMGCHGFSIPKDRRPRLTARIETDHTRITDTRPVAVSPEYKLTGEEHELHTALAHPLSLEQARAATADTMNRSSFGAALQGLEDKKLVVRIHDTFMAVACREPITPFFYDQDFDFNIFIRSIINEGRRLFGTIKPGAIKPETETKQSATETSGE